MKLAALVYRPRRFLPAVLLLLAPPLLGVTITVTDATDALHSPGCATTGTGTCTLRDAITFANTTVAADEIHFNIFGSGVHTIHPTSNLPNITQPVTMDGYTQSGASPNTLAVGDDAVLLIEVSGDAIAGTSNGLTIFADACTIRGLVINRFSNPGIYIDSTGGQGVDGGHVIEGNFIGTDPTGTIARPNGAWGVFLRSPNNRLGGTTPAARNVISGNGPPPGAFTAGVRLEADFGATLTGTVVQGNYIGTDSSGTAALGNGDGIALFGGSGVTIGGTTASARNVISGNAFVGINLGAAFCPDTTGVLIRGNFIGADASGAQPLGNARGGFHAFCGTHDNVIGGGANAGNVIAFNGGGASNGGGVLLDGTSAGNAVLGNSIFSNASSGATLGLGIDLSSNGPTANDSCDADAGPNGAQNAPIVSSVVAGGGNVQIQGTLNSTANATFRIELFSNPIADASGYDEGRVYLGGVSLTTDGVCHGSFTATFPGSASNVTATATAQATNDTSEFSHAQAAARLLAADPAASAASDGNGVFEPGETAAVRPSWKNLAGSPLSLTGSASSLSGPAGGNYSTADAAASYGSIPTGGTQSCAITANCYSMSAAPTGARPVTHWDAHFTETPSSGDASKEWTLHLGDSFTDVPRSQLFYNKIETIFHHGITVGCTAAAYCPSAKVPRSQMAIFIARGIAHGAALPASGTVNSAPYNCIAGGTSLFTDVLPTDISCKGVHFIAAQNVTTGCAPALYCPALNVSRESMAIFMAKALEAPGGGAAVPLTYGPDPVTALSYSCEPASPNLHFTDISASDSFCKHVHFLWAKGIIAGCSATEYCPDGNVGRDEMAKFLGNAFGLLLYGP